MFEYQTAISELTGLPVSNASLYEGPSPVAAAGYLAKLENKRTQVRGLARPAPALARDAATYAAGFGTEVVEAPLDDDGATDLEALAAAVDDDTAAVFLQQPNFLGTVEDLGALVEAAKSTGALSCAPPTRCRSAILEPPGEFGVDIASARARRSATGSTSAARRSASSPPPRSYIRKMPGRIAGETKDVDGRRGFVLTLQTREQHIRREKATHNICTAQALNALAGVIYLSWLGKRGVVELGELMLQRTALRARGARARADQPGPGRARVRRARAGPRRACSSARGPRASTPATASAATTPSTRTACWWRSPSGAPRRDIDTLAAADCRDAGAGGDAMTPSSTPAATRTRSRSSSARSEGRRAFTPPSSTCRRCRSPSCCPPTARRKRPGRAARGLRAGDRAPLQQPLEEELRPRHRLLPARLVHDEAQPEAARARRGAARATRGCTRSRTRSTRRARSS